MKKQIINISILFTLFTTLEAASSVSTMDSYMGYMWLLTAFVLLILSYFLIKSKKEISEFSELLKEKDEKIKWLREISAKNENRQNLKIQDLEKRVLELTHEIEMLEQKAKEGTKNQVVAKIEELENKRKNAEDQL
ncbi:hypothetical protein MNB_SV-5-390 [hydrothermal vent metagenome]|uniref:Uncharacterized protein n=1 Tax=hydrothermal vent metagenome TaxID=652676 RepID=A0A1W1EF91_9ZZZZ